MTVKATFGIEQRLWHASLKARVTGLTLVLFVAAIWLLAFGAAQELRQGFQEEIATQQSAMVHYVAETIGTEISNRVASLTALSARISPEWMQDKRVMTGFLEQHPGIIGLFKLGVYVIAKDGAGVADFPRIEARSVARYDDLDYFQEVMATGRPALGKPRSDRFSGQPVIVIAVPIKDETGALIGVLAGSNAILGSDIFRNIREAAEKSRMDIHIISRRDHLFVASTDTSLVFQPAPQPDDHPQHDRDTDGYGGSGIAVNSRGVEELRSAAPIPDTGWFAAAALPTDVAFLRINNTERRLYWEAAGLSLVFVVLIWMFVYREVAPLSRHAAALRRMTAGETPLQPVPVEGSTEIRQLVESFNQLCLRLKVQKAILQESESRFRHLADSIPVLVWLADIAKAYFYFNKPWLDFTGRSSEQDAGKGWTEGIHPDDLERWVDVYVESFDARRSFAMEYRLRRHDGEYRWIYDQGTPRIDAAGTFLGYVGGCIDITERKLAEQRMIEARQTAEAASRAKSAFLAMMSHELRTPMTGVIGMADFLSVTPLNAEQYSYINTMRSSASTLLGVLNNLLDYSKIDADRLTLDFVSFDAVALTAETMRLFVPKAAENASVVSLDIERPGPSIVRGDPTRIKQVLGNLVGNAVKFTKNGKIIIRLRQEQTGERFRLRFEVEDTGIGISAADLGRLFLPFSQVDAGTTRKFGGTGLGLAISKRLVELMGGEIGATSWLGRGSVFCFTCIVDPGCPDEQASAPQKARVIQPMTILLAEDNQINCMIIKVGLEQRRHRVVVVDNGVQAYEAAAGQQFDLILMDMQMPVMDGAEATRRIRSLPKPSSEVPIVALTADAVIEHRNAYMEAGLSDFLTKPIEWSDVDAVLARHAPSSDNTAVSLSVLPLLDQEKFLEIRSIMSAPDFAEFIGEFGRYSRDGMSRLRLAIASNDLDATHRIAHDIKGMFSNIGAIRVVANATMLQTVENIEKARDLFSTFEDAVHETVEEFERIL